MGRSVVAEETVKTCLTSTTSPQKLQIGLLIGKVTESKDLIALAVHTPPLQDFNAAGDKGDDGNDTVVDWWVVEHAYQVYSMLPGGLDVVGVFICCPSQSLPPLQTRLAKLLADVGACQEFRGHVPHQHQTLLHYCQTKKKFKCQTINQGDAQAGFKPAEFKLKSHLSQWCQIESTVRLDTVCYIPSPLTASSGGSQGEGEEAGLNRAQAREGLAELLERVQGGVVTLRGHLAKKQDDTLIKQGKKQQSNKTREVVQATLYLKRVQSGLTPPTRILAAKRVALRGCVSVLAYVSPKATYAEAIAAVKQDICRSLVSRVQAMVEGCGQGTGTGNQDQLPIRVALSAPDWQFSFTEYSLPLESDKECIQRASDLLGPDVAIITTQPLEQFGEEKGEGLEEVDTGMPLTGHGGGGFKWYYGLISIFASISAVLISISLWIMLQ